jgi:hypothetical protein
MGVGVVVSGRRYRHTNTVEIQLDVVDKTQLTCIILEVAVFVMATRGVCCGVMGQCLSLFEGD